MAIPVFGKEQYPLRKESGLSYTISDIYKHVPLHTHNHYELFIISEGTAYHLINDSVQTVKKGDLFFIRPNDMHSYSFFHSENFCVRNLGFSTQVLRNVSLFLEQEEKMDKLINSEMPAYVHLEGENFRKVLDCHGYCRKSGKRKPSQACKISCTVYHCASSGGLFFHLR